MLSRREAATGPSRGTAIAAFSALVTSRKTTAVSGRVSCQNEAIEITREASLGRQAHVVL